MSGTVHRDVFGDTDFLHHFNVPDFVIGPTRFDGREASRIINDEYRKDFGVRKEAASE